MDSEITSGFPLEHLNQRENFLSLLHYLLGIRELREGTPRLGIPNQTGRRLMCGYLRDGYRDVGLFAVDLYAFSRLVHEMACLGAWRPLLEFLAAAIRRQTGILGFLRSGREQRLGAQTRSSYVAGRSAMPEAMAGVTRLLPFVRTEPCGFTWL